MNPQVCLLGMWEEGKKEIVYEVKVNKEIISKPKEYEIKQGNLYIVKYTFHTPLIEASNLFNFTI